MSAKKNIFYIIPRELFELIIRWLSEHHFRKLRCVDNTLLLENRNYFFTCIMNIDITRICNHYWSRDLWRYINCISDPTNIHNWTTFIRLIEAIKDLNDIKIQYILERLYWPFFYKRNRMDDTILLRILEHPFIQKYHQIIEDMRKKSKSELEKIR